MGVHCILVAVIGKGQVCNTALSDIQTMYSLLVSADIHQIRPRSVSAKLAYIYIERRDCYSHALLLYTVDTMPTHLLIKHLEITLLEFWVCQLLLNQIHVCNQICVHLAYTSA